MVHGFTESCQFLLIKLYKILLLCANSLSLVLVVRQLITPIYVIENVLNVLDKILIWLFDYNTLPTSITSATSLVQVLIMFCLSYSNNCVNCVTDFSVSSLTYLYSVLHTISKATFFKNINQITSYPCLK